jgi:hypothetical protein
MSTGEPTDIRYPRRPLLGGGERLRENDVERGGGGGEGAHPYGFEEARALLKPQVERLAEQVTAMPDELRAEHVIIEATILPNYLAASHFPDALLAATQLYPVGTRQTTAPYRTPKRHREEVPTKTLLLAGSVESVHRLAGLIAAPIQAGQMRLWTQIREFHQINLPNPELVVRRWPQVGEGETITWEAVLNPVGRTDDEQVRWGQEAFEKFAAHIAKLSGEVDRDYRRVVRGVTFVPVLLPVEEVLRAPEFNLLRAIRPMPAVRPVPSVIMRTTFRSPPLRPPPSDATPATDQVVAIFDGGIDPQCPFLKPYVTQHDLTPEAPEPKLVQHGTGVTSAFLHGPLTPGESLPRPVGRVEHYRVFPPPPSWTFDESLYWVLDQLVSVLKRPEAPRMANLSFGPDMVIDEGGEPSRWTAELDALAEEHGITIVVAAGNNGEEDDELGFNRVLVPADMVNGIPVGACLSREHRGRLQKAPYSACGWGRPGSRIAPLGVCFGGADDGEPFVVLGSRGKLLETAGTSFAAPLAMRGLCELSAGLGPERTTAAALRTFAAHYAHRPHGHKAMLRELGYGRLRESYREIWECAPNEVSVVYQDVLRRGERTAMRLPFPEGLDPDTKIRLTWTLGYLSTVEPANAAEYTRSGFEVVFRPHDNMRSIFHPVTKEKITDLDIERDRELLEDLLRTGAGAFNDVPIAHSDWRRLRPEAKQRLSGKWETLSMGDVRLQANELLRPRLDFLYLARRDGQLVEGAVPPMPITLVVTLRGPAGISLYDLVQNQYPVLTPIVQDVPVHVTAAA